MADIRHPPQQPLPLPHVQPPQQPRSYQVVKAATAVTAGGSFLILSGLTLAGTVIGLTVATPVLVIFSPVLVPAAITVFLLIAGFVTSGGFGLAAAWVASWIYRYVTGKHPPGADQLDQARMKLASKARDMKEFGQQQLGGGGAGGAGGGGHQAS
ncbi:Oleosin [Macleaya cordata]|uniref:Oleosin n=1 Tax=Macleaya cordata TaxID=56857 RepID=A0A200QN63_MACCD|nr:Oleosin [Macleaya cordata]